MDANVDMVVVLITASSPEEAETLARELVANRLAACVNTTNVHSRFTWKDAIEKADEVLLIVKTRSSLLAAVEELVRRVHSYEVPELVAIPVIAGHKPYLDWVVESTS